MYTCTYTNAYISMYACVTICMCIYVYVHTYAWTLSWKFYSLFLLLTTLSTQITGQGATTKYKNKGKKISFSYLDTYLDIFLSWAVAVQLWSSCWNVIRSDVGLSLKPLACICPYCATNHLHAKSTSSNQKACGCQDPCFEKGRSPACTWRSRAPS